MCIRAAGQALHCTLQAMQTRNHLAVGRLFIASGSVMRVREPAEHPMPYGSGSHRSISDCSGSVSGRRFTEFGLAPLVSATTRAVGC